MESSDRVGVKTRRKYEDGDGVEGLGRATSPFVASLDIEFLTFSEAV